MRVAMVIEMRRIPLSSIACDLWLADVIPKIF